jgi:ABC-type multidrug transport system ATPase subunit
VIETVRPMLTDSEKLKLSWKNVNYWVRAKYTKEETDLLDTPKKCYKKQIIKDAEGHVCQGEALFIMGSSGAGKTTLLNILSDRVSKGRMSTLDGKVLINDELKVTRNNFGSFAAYVYQEDCLFPSFTCEKAIKFAAQLRLNLPETEIQLVVEQIITDLNLHK